MGNPPTVKRTSDLELGVTRTFDAPARVVFEAWTKPELMTRWWAPRSSGAPLMSCEMDVRVGGGYRLEFKPDAGHSMVFFGKYVDVAPPSRLVWTNEEGGDTTVTTVTFAQKDGKTLLTMHELYPTKAALDASIAGMAEGTPEQFEQLDALLLTLER